MILCVCSKDLKFFEWPELKLLGQYQPHEKCCSGNPIKSFAWNNDGHQLVGIQTNGVATMFKPPSSEVPPPSSSAQQITKNKLNCASGVNAVNFSKINENIAAIGTCDGRVQIYDCSNYNVRGEYSKLHSPVDFIEFLDDDAALVVGCNNGQIILYNNKNGRPFMTYEVPYSGTLTALTAQKQLIAGGSQEGYMGVWDAETGDIKLISGQRSDAITYAQFHNQTVSTSGVEGGFITYDLTTNQVISFQNLKVSISSFAFPEGTYDVAIGTNTGQLYNFDRRCMDVPYKTTVLSSCPITKVAFSNAKPLQPTKKLALPKSVLTNIPFKNFVESRQAFLDDKGLPDAPNLLLQLNNPMGGSKTYTALNKEEPAEVGRKVILPKEELDKFVEHIKTNIQNYKTELAQNMFQKFYTMRIDGSKKFISLEENIKSLPQRRPKTATSTIANN